MSKQIPEKKVNYLVCVNSEHYSEVALHFASKVAQQNNGSVVLLHVIEPADYQSIGAIADKIRKEKIAEAEDLLAELAGKVNQWVGLTPVFIVREGLIESEIISLVKEDKSINMLVVGAAYETSSKGKILQPLVSAIGHKILIPMLIVPGNLTDEEIERLA